MGLGTGEAVISYPASGLHAEFQAPLVSLNNSRRQSFGKKTSMATFSQPQKLLVLVVEDEPLMRLHAVWLVESAGYDAIEASNADEAIALLEARKDIRIVFTDIDMPGSMDGLKLAACVRKRWPPIELIVTSGHFDLDDADLPARGRFFPKPYSDEEIVDTLHALAA
jgi:CheY-like chemotaxis protein